MPQACIPPELIGAAPGPDDVKLSSPEMFTGLVVSIVVPLPSCPAPFFPHQYPDGPVFAVVEVDRAHRR